MIAFRLKIVSLRQTLFDKDVSSVFLAGDEGEFELLPFHFPLMAALPEGEIHIAGETPIPLRQGVVVFHNNQCDIILEEVERE